MAIPQAPEVPSTAPIPAPPSIPGTVVTACVLWILYGVLALFVGYTTFHAGVISYFYLAFGVIFLVSGIQVLMAKASGLIGTGVTCIVLGAVELLTFLALGGGRSGDLGSIVLIVTLFTTGILVLSGILALVGNAKYKAWRASKSARMQ